MEITINGKRITGNKLSQIGKLWGTTGFTALGAVLHLGGQACHGTVEIWNKKPKRIAKKK